MATFDPVESPGGTSEETMPIPIPNPNPVSVLFGPSPGSSIDTFLTDSLVSSSTAASTAPSGSVSSAASTTSNTPTECAIESSSSFPLTSVPPSSKIVVFSGGSAANNLVDVFAAISERKRASLSYVIPISDNGGSSSELIRVFGGPGIGDLRSRLVRLIPDTNRETLAIGNFFNYRLSDNQEEARREWAEIIESHSPLWNDIPSEKKELIRSFLNLLHLEILKRIRPSSVFNFASASIGNLFLTGARLFTGSLESAIYLLSSICQIPSNVSVLPAINTNFTHHIAAELYDGSRLVGQNYISHPSEHSALGEASPTELEYHDNIEDANLPGSLPTLRKQYIFFSKHREEDLSAPIKRIWYINPYGQEIRPRANKKVTEAIEQSFCVIYSIGSLFTSIIPSLVLRGVGASLLSPAIRYKILILNSTIDRETGPLSHPMTALDFVAAIARAAGESQGLADVPPEDYRKYVSHIIYLKSEGTPVLDKDRFDELGISHTRVYGRKDSSGKFVYYDDKALLQVLDATIGRRDRGMSRRNTMHESFS